VDMGDAEAFLPSFPAEAWCNKLPYPSQEHNQILVSASGRGPSTSSLLAA
jgi:forkhead box protein N